MHITRSIYLLGSIITTTHCYIIRTSILNPSSFRLSSVSSLKALPLISSSIQKLKKCTELEKEIKSNQTEYHAVNFSPSSDCLWDASNFNPFASSSCVSQLASSTGERESEKERGRLSALINSRKECGKGRQSVHYSYTYV